MPLLLIAALVADVDDAPPNRSAPTIADSLPDQHLGKIIMFRPSSMVGAPVACPIRYQGRELVELGRGKWAEWTVKPGRYILANKTHSIEVTVDAGETRYVRCVMQVGITYRAGLEIADEYMWNAHKKDYTKKDVSLPPE